MACEGNGCQSCCECQCQSTGCESSCTSGCTEGCQTGCESGCQDAGGCETGCEMACEGSTESCTDCCEVCCEEYTEYGCTLGSCESTCTAVSCQSATQTPPPIPPPPSLNDCGDNRLVNPRFDEFQEVDRPGVIVGWMTEEGTPYRDEFVYHTPEHSWHGLSGTHSSSQAIVATSDEIFHIDQVGGGMLASASMWVKRASNADSALLSLLFLDTSARVISRQDATIAAGADGSGTWQEITIPSGDLNLFMPVGTRAIRLIIQSEGDVHIDDVHFGMCYGKLQPPTDERSVPCCPEPIKETLYASISAPGNLIDGAVVPILTQTVGTEAPWENITELCGSNWFFDLICPLGTGVGDFTLRMENAESGVDATVNPDGGASCSPLFLVFTYTTITTIASDCGPSGQTIVITITDVAP